jgi:hypothetical protein
MELACRAEAKDDMWVALAICGNQTGGRKDCRHDAIADRQDAGVDCAEQLEARNEICDELGPDAYDPAIDPDDFLSAGEIAADPNPFLPLVPGTEWVYEDGDETITVTVTDETTEILGVTAIVVRDLVEEDGEPIEDTIDWFAQDEEGNVWYMGEISQEFEDGELVSLDGSWKAGVDGAKPGIVMLASPEVGDFYRQEFALGEAEDVAEVISLSGTGSVPAGNCDGACLVTEETTPLEPDAREHKSYKAGIGLLFEADGETGEIGAQLVSFTQP